MTPSGGLHAAALSSRLARARSSRPGWPSTYGRPRVELEADSARVPARPGDRLLRQHGEVDRHERLVDLHALGQRDHVVHEVA